MVLSAVTCHLPAKGGKGEFMENRKSYFQGVLSGAAVMLLVSVIVFSICFKNVNKPNISVAEKSDSDYGSIQDILKDEKVHDKLQVLAEILDMFYYDEIDIEQVEQYLYKGIVAGVGDPYSAYYTKDEMKSLTEAITGVYSGVGITMSLDTEVGYVKVIKVNKNSPAADAGVLAGDYIYEVNGENIAGMDTSDVANLVRGEEGTTVDLTFLRGAEYVKYTLERKSIEEETVEWEMMDKNTGYIIVSKFDIVTIDSFKEAMEDLQSKGMERLIVDLRDNPGGSVDTANEIGEYLVPKGVLTYIQDKAGERKDYNCSGDKTWNGPLVVLVNGNSASASEIIAGAVKDYNTGKLVGTTTFGKGIVQTTTTLSDGSAVKYTFAKYYTPKGDNIHGKGIEPDVEVELDEINIKEGYSKETDNQLKRAMEVLDEQ